MKIYTKQGDTGTTSLVGGTRVAKDDPRVEAYGTVDELIAHIAYLRDCYGDGVEQELHNILSCLMTGASLLAAQGDFLAKMPTIKEEDILFLEQRIDAMNELVPKLDKFTLPGGHPAVSMAHICRTVCRRAERAAVVASRSHEVAPSVLSYLNRLSDYLYILGRFFSQKYNIKEMVWISQR